MTTKKLYDIDAYATTFTAQVLSCTAQATGTYAITLDQTLFFPEEGGQSPDQGTLGDTFVQDVQIKNDIITHFLDKPLEIGSTVAGEINWQHRFSNMQQHSGEHLFSGLAYQRFGYQNVGFHLSDQIVTMDFDGVFTEEELIAMEQSVNEAIAANIETRTGYPSPEELATLEYRSKLNLTEGIRIVEFPGYDVCACCAPHVHRTGEIGMFKIQSVQNYKGGVRISFLCGFRALAEYRKKAQIISDLTGILTTSPEQLADSVSKLKTQNQSLKTQLNNAKQSLLEYKISAIPAEQKDVILFESNLDAPVMRAIVNQLVEKHTGICGIFVENEDDVYTFIIGSRSVDCRQVAASMKETFSSRGGGSATMIQGSVTAEKQNILSFFESK